MAINLLVVCAAVNAVDRLNDCKYIWIINIYIFVCIYIYVCIIITKEIRSL